MAHEVVGDLLALLPLLRASFARVDQVSAAPTTCPLPPLEAALTALLAEAGAQRSSQLARRLGVPLARVRIALERLRADGVVVPERGAVTLAPAWRPYFGTAVAHERRYIVSILDRLDGEERRGLVRALRTLAAT